MVVVANGQMGWHGLAAGCGRGKALLLSLYAKEGTESVSIQGWGYLLVSICEVEGLDVTGNPKALHQVVHLREGVAVKL